MSCPKLLVPAVAAAVLACGAARAQPGGEPASSNLEQRLLQQIGELRSQGGVHAEGLIEPLRALAVLYQETDDHALAAVALREARQILRANRGLFSATVDEALLLDQEARSEKALGNGQRAWDLQHDLIMIARQHLGDIRMLPVFLELIDDRAERLEEFSTTNFRDLPPGLYVPCDPDMTPASFDRGLRSKPVPVFDARFCPFGTWRTVVTRLNGAVLRNYADAIAVMIRNGDYASQQLRALERQVLSRIPFEAAVYCSFRSFEEFLESELVDGCLDTAGGFGVGGWASLMRLVFYEERSGAPAAARARAYAELGDWYLWAERLISRGRFSAVDEIALELYEHGLAELGQDGEAREALTEVFSPELPVMLPTYAPNPLASTPSSRFIDVAFTISKYGEAGDIEVLASSQNATRPEERGLVRSIKYGRFRPRAVDGMLADVAPVVVRYYLPQTPPGT